MSIEAITGYTGSGKSYYLMKLAIDHLYAGGVVGMNFRLSDDWAYKAAFYHPFFRKGLASLDSLAESLYKRCFYVGTPATIHDLANRGQELCLGNMAKKKERKIMVIIDEAQLYLNPRNFKENFPWLQLGTQQRKLGLDVFFVCHSMSMLDNQVERLVSYITRVRNLREELKLPIVDIRFPWAFLFTAMRARESKKIRFRLIGPIRSRITELYNSYEIFAYDKLPTVLEPQGRLLNSCCVFKKRSCQRPPWPGRDADNTRTWLDLTGCAV